MRGLATVLLLATLLLLGGVGSASALSVLPNPTAFEVQDSQGGIVTAGLIEVVEITPSELTIRLTNVQGSPAGLKVRVVDPSQLFKTPTGVGTTFGPDVNVVDGFIEGNAAGVIFAPFLVRMQSDSFFLEYGDLLAAGDTIFFDIINSNNVVVSTVSTDIVPEPGTAFLLGIGLTGLVFSGQRRRQTVALPA